MVTKTSELSITRQCKLLNISRSGLYYQPKSVSKEELKQMCLLDEGHMKHPYYGSRRLKGWLADHGHHLSRKKVVRLMRMMGIIPIYPKKNTSKPNRAHKVYPYLLRGMTIDRPNQVWCTDISYIPMAKGFLYLVAIMDWHSRKVLSWRLSNTMDVHFCLEVLDEAVARFGAPEIFNSDQGAQFTSEAFTGALKGHGIQISMDGKGRCMDNIFIERLWRSLKYEEVYLKAYDSVAEARQGIDDWMRFYNMARKHQGLADQTPDSVYFGGLDMPLAA
jgi:putative transposase